jgi:hypothetical protein
MTSKRLRIIILLLLSFFTFACAYVVVPQDIVIPEKKGESTAKYWSGVATNVSSTASGDLHIDITLINNTADWSKLQAVPDAPARLVTEDGKSTVCGVVNVSTGGHRLAPGFQMRGFSTRVDGNLQTQLLYVECENATLLPGSKLTINYLTYSGILDDYEPDRNEFAGVLEIDLQKIVSDLSYPIATPIDGLIQPSDTALTGLSENVVTLLSASRADNIMQLTWQNFNPTKFALKTHIGTPPVIGVDGIIYGEYEILDMAPVPLTPPSQKVEWSTEVDVPDEVNGLNILLSLESNKPRTYINYVLDISDK